MFIHALNRFNAERRSAFNFAGAIASQVKTMFSPKAIKVFTQLSTFAALLSVPIAVTHAQSLVIQNVSIVSPHTNEATSPRSVVIKSGRIAAIIETRTDTKHSDAKHFDANTQVYDGTGKFLTPGIMDSHVHVSSIPGMGFGKEPVAQKHPQIVDDYYQHQPNSFLYYGVTQVLDPNPGANWQHFTSNPNAPDYLRCEVITSKDTFPLVEKSNALSTQIYRYLVNEKAKPEEPNSPEHLVLEIAQSGAHCIKLYFENGYGDADQWPLLSTQTLTRIRLAANEHKLSILAHANAYDMYQAAIAANVDVIAHGMWNWGPYARQRMLPNEIKTLLDKVSESGIGYMPTQRVIAGLGEAMMPSTRTQKAFDKVTPNKLRKWMNTDTAQWFQEELRIGFDGLPDETIANIFRYGRVGKGAQVMQYLANNDHPLLLGSDFPGSPSYANQPGLTTFLEIQMMAQAGVSNVDILKAATVNNAKQFGIADDYGTVEVGKIANLLLLNKNPLKDVSAWADISHVVLHGNVHTREKFAVK